MHTIDESLKHFSVRLQTKSPLKSLKLEKKFCREGAMLNFSTNLYIFQTSKFQNSNIPQN